MERDFGENLDDYGADIADLEERLYSKIHHDESYETVNPLNTEKPTTSRHVTNSSVVNSSVATNTSGVRYWAGNKRFYPQKEIGYVYKPNKPVVLGKNVIQSDNNPIQNRSKPLAPYTSFLSQMNLKDTDEETLSTSSVPSTSKNCNNKTSSKTKKSDTETKKDETEKPQKQPDVNSEIVKNIKIINSKMNKNINPFNKNAPVTLKTKKIEKLQAKKTKAAKNRKNKNIPVVILDSSADDDDDDVIEIPLPKPPLISIDSSDSESITSKSEFLSPNVKKKFKQKSTNSRCNSPASIMSDDFIMPNDRSRLNESRESLNILEDEELQINQTVDSVVTKKRLNTSQVLIQKIADVLKINKTQNPIVELKKQSAKNYEVNNSIASADIYESESSDMPDSVYNRVREKKTISEDKDDTADGKLQKKSKRMRKRKSSGSNKGSEHNSSSSDEDEFTIKNIVTTSSPYIMRGEAVQNAITDGGGKKPKILNKRRRFDSKIESDEEFISILSSIVHPDSETDDEVDTSKEKSINARDLVNHLKVVDELNEEVEEEIVSDDIQINVEIPQIEDESIMSVDECPDVLEMQCERRSPLIDQFEIGWNDEMKKFYNSSWGGEDFDIDEVMGSMNANAGWNIKNEDQYPKMSIPHNTRMKCFNCFEFGHIRAKCRAPFKKVICHMCGEANHSEPRCPNKICLKCGMETKVFIKGCNNCFYKENTVCHTCKIRGHTAQICPDRWRRYHSTTTDNIELIQSSGQNKRRYCSICAAKGHLAETCKYSGRCLDYPVQSSQVISYTKQYSEQTEENLIEFPYVKMSLECSDIEFGWDNEQMSPDGFYNRFLNSVGLKKRSKKRKIIVKPKKSKKKKMVLNPISVAKQNSLEIKEAEEAEVTNFNFSNELSKLNETNQSFDLNFITKSVPSNDTLTASSKDENIIEDNNSRTDSRSIFLNELTEETKIIDKTVKKKKKSDEPQDDDSNYSFSEFYDPNNDIPIPPDVPEIITPLTPAPDFISIEEIPKITNPVKIIRETDSNSTIGQITNAKIFLTKNNCKSLLSPNGTEFLRNAMETFCVSVRLEWQNVGNVLHIKGTTTNQDDFHEKLIEYIQIQHEENYRKRIQISSLVPKNKIALIRFIKKQFLLLTTNLGKVDSWYQKMNDSEKLQSSNARKAADKARKHLNMILIGQTGLLDGEIHLTALKNNLTSLENNLTDEIISKEIRDDIFQHVNYIFGPFIHSDYVGLINKYRDLKKEAKNDEKSAVVVKPVDENLNPVSTKIEAKPVVDTDTSSIKNVPSAEWSEKCLELILKCLELPKIKNRPLVKGKLERVYTKALANGLSNADHSALLKIYGTSSKDC